MCERLHCLPNPGGLLQQDDAHVKKLNIVYHRLDEYEKEQMDKPTGPSSNGT